MVVDANNKSVNRLWTGKYAYALLLFKLYLLLQLTCILVFSNISGSLCTYPAISLINSCFGVFYSSEILCLGFNSSVCISLRVSLFSAGRLAVTLACFCFETTSFRLAISIVKFATAVRMLQFDYQKQKWLLFSNRRNQ